MNRFRKSFEKKIQIKKNGGKLKNRQTEETKIEKNRFLILNGAHRIQLHPIYTV